MGSDTNNEFTSLDALLILAALGGLVENRKYILKTLEEDWEKIGLRYMGA